VKIGGRDDGGVDILSTNKDSIDVAIQCKRRKLSVGPWAIREVAGAVAGGRHARRRPVLMTNAPVTPRRRKTAEEAGVRVIARKELVHAIWQLKNKAHTDIILDCFGEAAGDYARPAMPSKLLPETMVTLGIASCGIATVLVVVLHAVLAAPRPAAASPTVHVTATAPAAHLSDSASQPRPAEVVREYYAAISRHDWPSVWRLGGRNLGRGSYATYSGMAAGYKGTIRDTLTTLHTSGNTVSGRFLAYQTGGVTVPYRFTFMVHNGVIISGKAEYDTLWRFRPTLYLAQQKAPALTRSKSSAGRQTGFISFLASSRPADDLNEPKGRACAGPNVICRQILDNDDVSTARLGVSLR
jgi:hypothetical protein